MSNFTPTNDLNACFKSFNDEQLQEQNGSNQELSIIKNEAKDKDVLLVEEIDREAQEEAVIKAIERVPRIMATTQCVFKALNRKLSKEDSRQKSKVVYPSASVLTIAMIARLCNYINAKEIALFYNNFYPFLSKLVCDLPPAECRITPSTVSRILSSINSKIYEKLFNKFFGAKLRYKRFKKELKRLRVFTFDGQENRSGYVKGCPNRQKKGNQIVSIVEGETGLVWKFVNVCKKNQEDKAFLSMLAEIPDATGMLFTCDALNARKSVLAEIIRKNGDCGLKIKGNSNLIRQVKALFTSEELPIYAEDTLTVPSGGKIAEHKLQVVHINEENVPEVKNWSGLTTAVKVTTNRDKVIAGKTVKSTCREYFMVFTTDDMQAIRDTILQSWSCETMHYTNDLVFLSDKMAITNKNHIAGQNALNKAAYNVLNVQTTNSASGKETPFREQLLRNAANPKLALLALHDYIVNELGFKIKLLQPCKEFAISRLLKC